MKNLKTLTTVLFLTGFLTVSQAFTPNNKVATDSHKEFMTSMTNKISHNDLAWDLQKNTEVVAEIHVSNQGHPEIMAINGDEDYRKLVGEKLTAMKLDNESLYGKTFVCRFKFRTN